jgi:hypothetical protein
MRKAGFVGGIVLGVVVIGGLAALALRPDSTSQKADSTPTPEATLAPLADQVMPVGAGTTLTPTPLPTRDEPGIDAKNISVRFVNGLDTDVCWLYIRQNGESQWGDDRLGSSTILSPGDNLVLGDLPPDLYDIRADDCVNRELWFIRGMALRVGQIVVIGAGSTTATPSPTPDGSPTPVDTITLTFINRMLVEVCYLYISPNDSDSWGDDWLGAGTILNVGESITIPNIARGIYDLRADNCDDDELWSEMAVPLTGNHTISIQE